MPGVVSRMMREAITLLDPLLKRLDLEQSRKLQDDLGALAARVMSPNISYEQAPFDIFEAEWAVPKQVRAKKAILYLHGGSYTAGTLSYAKGFGGVLAETMGFETLCVGYRLAPEHPYPAAMEDAMEAYQYMLTRYAPADIAWVGESAGGGLCYGLALKCENENIALPGCIVAISPWTDLTLSGASVIANRAVDIMLRADSLAESAHMYAGTNLENPLVSPLFGDLNHMPPTRIFAGSAELLTDDSTRMEERLQSAGADVQLHIEEGMWHAYVLYGVPEAKQALESIRTFIWKEIGYGEEA